MMNEGRDRGLWWHTASLESTIANTVRDAKKRRRPWRPEEFHPWEERDKRERRKKETGSADPTADISILKAVFVDHKSLDTIEDEFGI